jgi:NAD-dependent dihydropyrimidine dehydrogenase PreA subunit
MEQKKSLRPILFWLISLIFVLLFSSLSTQLWGGKSEKIEEHRPLTIQEDMTLAEFGEVNQLSNSLLKSVFGLTTKEDLQKKLKDCGLSVEEINKQVNKALVLQSEHESKNWFKIPVKFASWLIFLGIVFFLVRKNRITPQKRKGLFIASVMIFGVALGSDPSPMGTVKDAIVLFGKSGVIFPPRILALSIFLLMVFVANKLICAWGCQFGTLQDLFFRFNRDPKDQKAILRQLKPPFILSNTIRATFFFLIILAAFLWATDLVEPIDPFRVFNPLHAGVAGLLFIGGLSFVSLFIYRPWCHFFCPFGFVGWIVEKVSLFKINVNYETCIACEACAKACPSTVMEAILKQNRIIPDCFACATCMHTCPTNSIHFELRKREKPPAGKFEKRSSTSGLKKG